MRRRAAEESEILFALDRAITCKKQVHQAESKGVYGVALRPLVARYTL